MFTDNYHPISSLTNSPTTLIKTLPTMTIKQVIDTVKSHFDYEVNYRKARKAKKATTRCCMVIGNMHTTDSQLLGAMAATSPWMYHVVEPFGQKTREYKGATARVFR
jgi:hypothetical protein